MEMPDTFEAPVQKEYVEKEALGDWLMDSAARDQYVVTHGPPATGTTTDVFWNDVNEPRPKPLVTRKK